MSFTRKKVLIISTIAVAALLAGGAVYVATRPSGNNSEATSATDKPVNTIDYTEADDSEKAVNDDRKTKDAAPTRDSTNTTPSISLNITRATIDNDSKEVVIGTLVSGTTTGTCTLELSRQGSSSITKSSNITLQNNTYSCSNFIIPFSEFPTTGDWKAVVRLSANDSSATSTWPNPITIPMKQ